jgi:parvulin-like peptidyl-prolyl isomerase
MANVRHLLVAFEGGTTDSNGKTVYTDAEKAAAKEKADKLLKEWMEGDATEESFAALATEHTDDDGSKENGGLYEDINEDTTFVEPFLNWALADHKPGDTEIVETEYGYHIMYYSSTDELTYRDALISTTLKNTDIENWYNGIVDAATVKEGDTSKLRLDLVLTSAS